MIRGFSMGIDFVSWQFMQLLISAGCGVLLGIFYDLYRLFRYYCSFGRRTLCFFDVLWWALAFILVFGACFWVTVGDIYFYYIIWQVLGFWLYYRLVSCHVFRLGKKMLAELDFKLPRMRLAMVFPWLIMVLAGGIIKLLRLLKRVFCIVFRTISNYFKAFKTRRKK